MAYEISALFHFPNKLLRNHTIPLLQTQKCKQFFLDFCVCKCGSFLCMCSCEFYFCRNGSYSKQFEILQWPCFNTLIKIKHISFNICNFKKQYIVETLIRWNIWNFSKSDHKPKPTTVGLKQEKHAALVAVCSSCVLVARVRAKTLNMNGKIKPFSV